MSYMKHYLEEHINDYTEEELLKMGYIKEEIQLFRESFPKSKKTES